VTDSPGSGWGADSMRLDTTFSHSFVDRGHRAERLVQVAGFDHGAASLPKDEAGLSWTVFVSPRPARARTRLRRSLVGCAACPPWRALRRHRTALETFMARLR